MDTPNRAWHIVLAYGPFLEPTYTTLPVEAPTRAKAIVAAKRAARADGFGAGQPLRMVRVWSS